MKIIGSGEIEEVTKGKVYRIRHHLGRDPKTGRYIRSPKKTVYGTKADARRALEGKKTYDTWQQGFLQIFEAVQANRPFIMNVYRSVSREHVESYLYKLTYDLLIGVVEERARDLSVRECDREFIAHFYKYAFVGIMLDWIRDDMRADPKVIVNRLGVMLHGSIRAALERAAAGRTPQTGNFLSNPQE